MPTRLSAPTLSGTRRTSPLYQVMGTGLTNTVLLIGHANADRMYEPHQVTSMTGALNFLQNDFDSPLVQGLLEAYAAGCKDVWVYAAAPMSEYEENPALRINYNTIWGGLNFYQKYYARLDDAYKTLMVYDFFELVVPIEAPFYDTGRKAQKYIDLPGTTGNYLSTPDAAALDITGDICIVARLAMDDWTPTAASAGIVTKYVSAGNQLSYAFVVNTDGKLIFSASAAGASNDNYFSTVATGVVDGAWKWLAVTLDVDNGASGRSARFWMSDDGTTWTQLGATVTYSGTGSIFNSTSPLEIGTNQYHSSNFLAGNISYVSVRNGIGAGGTVGGLDVFRFDAEKDFYMIEPTVSSFKASTNQTITINKSGVTPTSLVTAKVDYCTQLATFCSSNFALTSSCSMGIMGTRVPNFDLSTQKITNYNSVTIDEMVNDTRSDLLIDKGKFVMVVVGEGVFIPEKRFGVYNRSLEVATAALLATTPLDRSFAGLLLPGVAAMTSQEFSPVQLEALSKAKLNPAVKTATGRRGASFQVRIMTDNTLGADGSDFWSAIQMRVCSAIINKIRAIGYAYIGSSFEEFRKNTYAFLDYLSKEGYIDQFSASIVRSENDPNRAIVDVAVKPIIGIKNITFSVEVAPGA